MKKIFLSLALCFTICFYFLLSPEAAAGVDGGHGWANMGTLIDAKALNAAAALRTFTVGPAVGSKELLDYGMLVVTVDYTYAAATDVQMACTATSDSGLSVRRTVCCAGRLPSSWYRAGPTAGAVSL